MPRAFLAFLLLPIFFSACSTNNVTVDDGIGKYFDSAGVHGCFGLFDNGQGHFTIYNLPRFRDSAYQPGATFDILQLLIAFQRGTLKDDKAMLRVGDSALNVTEAFRALSSDNDAFFNRLADSLGKDSIKKWVDSLRYGNQDLKGPDAAAAKNNLKITADEQLGLTKKLYFDQLPFFKRSHDLVRDMMTVERNSNYKLVYKVGRVGDNDHVLGWVMGWVEENKHPYFFVLNFDSGNGRIDVSTVGLQLVKKILRSMGFFEGKK